MGCSPGYRGFDPQSYHYSRNQMYEIVFKCIYYIFFHPKKAQFFLFSTVLSFFLRRYNEAPALALLQVGPGGTADQHRWGEP